MLIVFAGLPGTGKSSIARAIAEKLGAVFIRIDTIEQVLADAGAGDVVMADPGLSYLLGYALATENLKLGRTVVADSVNGLAITRDAWRAAAVAAGVPAVDVEVVCSDAAEHRRRVEERTSDIAGLNLPTWAEVEARDYHAWDRDRVVIDTAGRSLEACVEALSTTLARL